MRHLIRLVTPKHRSTQWLRVRVSVRHLFKLFSSLAVLSKTYTSKKAHFVKMRVRRSWCVAKGGWQFGACLSQFLQSVCWSVLGHYTDPQIAPDNWCVKESFSMNRIRSPLFVDMNLKPEFGYLLWPSTFYSCVFSSSRLRMTKVDLILQMKQQAFVLCFRDPWWRVDYLSRHTRFTEACSVCV